MKKVAAPVICTRLNGPAGDERNNVAEAVAGVDDDGRVLLRIFEFVLVAAQVGCVGPSEQTNM
jgi:hypothetical protein